MAGGDECAVQGTTAGDDQCATGIGASSGEGGQPMESRGWRRRKRTTAAAELNGDS